MARTRTTKRKSYLIGGRAPRKQLANPANARARDAAKQGDVAALREALNGKYGDMPLEDMVRHPNRALYLFPGARARVWPAPQGCLHNTHTL